MSILDKLIEKPESATYADERQFWSIEKASNGQKYYFNKKTKESQWEKPECLKTPEEKENQTDWIECTKSDGRVFFYNTQTKKSQWQIPAELKVLRQQQAEKRRIREQQGYVEEEEEIEINVSDEQKKEIDQRNFLEMLRENKVTISMKWDQAQKLMQHDQRWVQIKQISEKKRLFQDYIQKVKRMERQEQQNKSEKAKEDYIKLLEETNLSSDCKFYKIAPTICIDPRFRALEEKSRETYFQDFLDKQLEQEQENQKDDRRIHGINLKRKINSVCVTSSLYRWAEFQKKFQNDNDFKKLNEFDRICIFSEAMYELEKVENDERRKNKRKTERLNRENFRELLRAKIALGEINHKTKWKNFVQTIKDSPEFLNLLGQTGSLPHELFEDQQDLLIENHKSMKAEIKQHIKQSGMKVVADISYKEFIEKTKQLSVFDTLEEYLKNFYYHYFIQKAKLKEKETLKKHKKAQRKYLRFLKTLYELNQNSQFSHFQDVVTKGLGEEINSQIPLLEREEIFKEYVATLDPNFKDSYYDTEIIKEENKNNTKTQQNFTHQVLTTQQTTSSVSVLPHNPPSISKQEPSPSKKLQSHQQSNEKSKKIGIEEGEEGEIPEQENKYKTKQGKRDQEQEEGEEKDSESEGRQKDRKKQKISHHSHHHQYSSRPKNKRSVSRSRQDKKKDKKKSHKTSRSRSESR